LTDVDCERISQALALGTRVTDVRFDRVYEGRWREPSEAHWSPIRVAQRAVELLRPKKKEAVLDIGSGAGKFCLIGALTSPAQFVGVERRPALVEAANLAKQKLGAARARFVHGDALKFDWESFDCLYFFNPFGEHLLQATWRIDNSVPFSEADHAASVSEAYQKLSRLRAGARVALYWGYGEAMPDSFQLLRRERHGAGDLEVWRKRR
jgi:SAM-dependent methyltransferase